MDSSTANQLMTPGNQNFFLPHIAASRKQVQRLSKVYVVGYPNPQPSRLLKID